MLDGHAHPDYDADMRHSTATPTATPIADNNADGYAHRYTYAAYRDTPTPTATPRATHANCPTHHRAPRQAGDPRSG